MSKETLWVMVPEKTHEYWLEVKDPDGWYSASIKFDGCIHYHRYYNSPMDTPDRDEEDVDYIHICDIDGEIERLRSLKLMALGFFGSKWPR